MDPNLFMATKASLHLQYLWSQALRLVPAPGLGSGWGKQMISKYTGW